MNKLGILLVAGALAGWGCNQQPKAEGYKPEEVKTVTIAEFEPGKEEVLMPFKVGNEWVYEVDIDMRLRNQAAREQTTRELVFRCTNVRPVGKQTRAVMEAVEDDKVNERQVWILNNKGLFQTSVGMPEIPFEPAQPAFRRPVKPGSTFQWQGKGFVPDGSVSDAQSESKIEPLQEVDTGIGRIKAYPVTTVTKWKNGVAQSTTWWAPGIGIVRYRQEVAAAGGVAIQVMRLKSTNVVKVEKEPETEKKS